MLLSGQKTSYYEEYQRKKETKRSLVSPPTLLTDRGAYVNFLEVQLERVSAACLAVQSYDDRFSDMQNLIIALENRCATTTRLTSLAQQCSEEIRAESFTITNKLHQDLLAEQKKSSEVFESLSAKIHSADNRLHTVSTLESRLLLLEKRYHALEDAKILADTQHMQEIQQMKSRVDNVLSENHDLRAELQHTNTLLSQQVFDAQELANKTRNLMENMADRFEARLAAIQEDCDAKLHSMQCKHNNYIDSLNYSFAQRELELNNLHSKQYGKVGCDLTELNQLVGSELQDVKSTLHTTEAKNISINETLHQIKEDVSNQQSQLFQLEDKFITRLEGLLQRYRFPFAGKNDDEDDDNDSESEQIAEVQDGLNSSKASTLKRKDSELSESKKSVKSKQNDESMINVELQSLLASILNTTNANNTTLNAIASQSRSNTPSYTNKRPEPLLSVQPLTSPARSSRSWSQSPRSELQTSRSLSPQRLLGPQSLASFGSAGAAVSIDRDRQLSRDSVRAMGYSPSRSSGPPPLLDYSSLLNDSRRSEATTELKKVASSASLKRRGSASSVDKMVRDAVSPQRVNMSDRSGFEGNVNSPSRKQSDSSKSKSGKKSSGKRLKNKTPTTVDDAVNDIAKSLSFSFGSPSRLRNVSNPRVSSTATSVESLRQSADRLLKSPPRVSGATAALFSKAEQDFLREKGVSFRSECQEFEAGLRKYNDYTSDVVLGPAWKPINTYVPPVAYTMFDNARPTSSTTNICSSGACVTGSGDGKGNSNPSRKGSSHEIINATNGTNSAVTSAKEIVTSNVVEKNVPIEHVGSCDYAGNNIVTKIQNSLQAIRVTQSSSTDDNSRTVQPIGSSNAAATEVIKVNRQDVVTEGTQTASNNDNNDRSTSAERKRLSENAASKSNTRDSKRSASNLRSAANRVLGISDADAHVSFYRPVSPSSHSRLSKILEQYPI